MGAKQSKRSVDISGKEAEGGEVAATGAGGEGRLEPIADADTLKPQVNGDAPHIQTPDEKTDKEKQLDAGTPENEKDATTEKETVAPGEDAPNVPADPADPVDPAPATNGEAEVKENGDAAPAVDDGKKPKKEKVKKKWSLRSISFSRKDKPKQEKKAKDEEKTNGDSKVPEEAAEATAVAAGAEPALPEVAEEKTPETPVTEPLTNGSPADAPAAIAPAPAAEPEQLPVNGLSLEEPKEEAKVESKPEEPVAAPEPAPVPEIPAKAEVCVDKVTPVESTPPPLPANPPPSSVVSFAATTMAPELADTSLANTIGTVLTQPIDTVVDRVAVAPVEALPVPPVIDIPSIVDVPKAIEDAAELVKQVVETSVERIAEAIENVCETLTEQDTKLVEQPAEDAAKQIAEDVSEHAAEQSAAQVAEETAEQAVEQAAEQAVEQAAEQAAEQAVEQDDENAAETLSEAASPDTHEQPSNDASDAAKNTSVDTVSDAEASESKDESTSEPTSDAELPPPPADVIGDGLDSQNNVDDARSDTVTTNGHSEPLNGNAQRGSAGLVNGATECNGNGSDDERLARKLEQLKTDAPETGLPPPPPHNQDAVHDKIADLIPEVPELPTETILESSSDVAVAD